ncbi:MAG: DUF6531 domain-containing protein, partial [Gammaproteobacteria bacterium]|nr:DUF6531 domain-containing protein [Gammaproteobacteria bacterium]
MKKKYISIFFLFFLLTTNSHADIDHCVHPGSGYTLCKTIYLAAISPSSVNDIVVCVYASTNPTVSHICGAVNRSYYVPRGICGPNVQLDKESGQCVPIPETQKQAGQLSCNNENGNPCDASTGNKFQIETDYTSTTLNFIRYYNSINQSASVLGNQWSHQYLTSLSINHAMQLKRHDGKILTFSYVAGSWKSDADITETLTQLGSNWEYKTNNDSIQSYNNIGQLLTETTRDGKTTTYTYNTNGLLEQVTDPYGHNLQFTYDASNRLITLTTPENTQIHYAYDDVTNNLTSVTYPDSTPGDLTDNPQKIYHYEDTNFPNHLTGITDENGNRYATWAYNTSGLATLSEHANSAEKVELAYNTDETTTVTDALGRVKTYTFETHYGLRKPKTIEYTYNDGHQVVTKQKTYSYYPGNGRVKEVTDYNDHITYYEYNDRGLITLETQGKGTPEEYNV